MRLHLDAGQRQEIVDQAAHPGRLLVHDLQEAVARHRIVAGRPLQRLDEAGERGQRRAQLVAGIGDEIDADAVDAPALAEIVEDENDELAARLPRRRRGRRTRRRTSARSARARRTRPARAGRRAPPGRKAATRSGLRRRKVSESPGADREGGDGALVGVADDAAPVENEAGIGQRLGEDLDAAFASDAAGAGRVTAASARRRCARAAARRPERAGRETAAPAAKCRRCRPRTTASSSSPTATISQRLSDSLRGDRRPGPGPRPCAPDRRQPSATIPFRRASAGRPRPILNRIAGRGARPIGQGYKVCEGQAASRSEHIGKSAMAKNGKAGKGKCEHKADGKEDETVPSVIVPDEDAEVLDHAPRQLRSGRSGAAGLDRGAGAGLWRLPL